MAEYLQPELPLQCYREVKWLTGESLPEPKFGPLLNRLLGRNALAPRYKLKADEGHYPPVASRTMDAGKINESNVADPDLRYALRFADAANAMGWIGDPADYGSASGHFVGVVATDEGVNGRLLHATYTGNEGRFEEDLRLFKPE